MPEADRLSLGQTLLLGTVFSGLIGFGVFVSRPRTGSRIVPNLSDLAMLAAALDEFKLDCGHYPSKEEGILALTYRPKDVPGWHGPYLSPAMPRDRAGEPFKYVPSPDLGHFQAFAYGGECGDVEEGHPCTIDR